MIKTNKLVVTSILATVLTMTASASQGKKAETFEVDRMYNCAAGKQAPWPFWIDKNVKKVFFASDPMTSINKENTIYKASSGIKLTINRKKMSFTLGSDVYKCKRAKHLESNAR